MLDVCLMGCGGSIPKPDRWLTSALFRYGGECVVIDCGEGTQLAMKEAGFVAGKVALILLTHFHADHVSGLPGLLLSIANEGRVDPVVIAGPKGTSRIVSSLCVIAQGLPFQIYIYEFPNGGGELPAEYLPVNSNASCAVKIKAYPGRHRMPCLGYRISLPRGGKFDPVRAKAQNIPVKLWSRLQKGETVEADGVTYTPDMVLGGARRGIDVSYVTDTRPTEGIVEAVRGSDLLICEGMFGSDKTERAKISRHMTAVEAANIAKEAEVRTLWLTHYSPSMPDPKEAEAEAKLIFPATEAGYDGKHILMQFED